MLAIYLLPDYQRKGIGTALFAKGSRHVKKVIVHVERENQSGMSFIVHKGLQLQMILMRILTGISYKPFK
ncbi:N-acetyltransferase family protein [Priestia flexa]|uniref:N-acetyltransferase domain-containing protein n=1 Tax=Priestia flexa TaxID=86664 RepID=A0ABU4J8G8_9BACI|nr:GNAT family N-acetyltransferase [Priestia flexa]MDW8517288.1 hypothetical protein [Priestia flexa]